MGISERDIFWLAGLLEGEGSFVAGPPSAPTCPAVALPMTDRDFVERAAELLDRAVCVVRPKPGSNHKTAYATRVKGATAAIWMSALRPLMGSRRCAQIDRALAGLPPRRARWKAPAVACATARCARPAATKGLCKIHYHLWWKSKKRGTAPRYFPIDPPPPVQTVVLTGPAPDLGDDRWLAWLAGLFEGEGTFSSNGASYPVIQITMCDLDVLERAAELIGVRRIGRVHDPRALERGWTQAYRFGVGGARAAELMRRLRPFMGQRRSGAIDRALGRYRPVRLVRPPATCVVTDCTGPHEARGLCHKHYMSWHRDRKRGREPRVKPLR